MRARSLRPAFDRLDTRLFLDASAANMVCGATLGATALPVVDPNGSTGPQDLVSVLNWYLPGTPPPELSDPSSIEIPWALVATD
jgi:hypothetical protein